MTTTVVVGTNRLTDCRTIIGWQGCPLLEVARDPLRLTFSTPSNGSGGPRVRIKDNQNLDESQPGIEVVAEPRSVSIFWGQTALAIATLLDSGTIHLKLDLRPLGLNVFDDADGLHIGSNLLSHNEIVNCVTAINVGPTPNDSGSPPL